MAEKERGMDKRWKRKGATEKRSRRGRVIYGEGIKRGLREREKKTVWIGGDMEKGKTDKYCERRF